MAELRDCAFISLHQPLALSAEQAGEVQGREWVGVRVCLWVGPAGLCVCVCVCVCKSASVFVGECEGDLFLGPGGGPQAWAGC